MNAPRFIVICGLHGRRDCSKCIAPAPPTEAELRQQLAQTSEELKAAKGTIETMRRSLSALAKVNREGSR